MAALTSRKIGQVFNQDLAFILATGGGNEDIINLDGTALTGSGGTSDTTFDYAAILAGTATNAANVQWIDLTDDDGRLRFSQVLVYPLWFYTSAITLSTAPIVALMGEIPAAANTSPRLVPSTLHSTLAPVETRSFVRLLDRNDGPLSSFATTAGACNVAGSKKIWRGLPIAYPVYGIRSLLCSVVTVGALSDASGKLLVAMRGIA